jgi:MFS family permease
MSIEVNKSFSASSADTSRQRRIGVLLICSMSVLVVSLDVTIVNVALPSIGRDFHASLSGLQWAVDAYTLVLASVLMLSGSTADRLGRRRTFVTGLGAFVAGSLLCSVAPNLTTLIVFRMLQAIGGSMLNPVAMSIITNTFTDAKERAQAIGVWAAVVGISMALGPVLGGLLVDTVGWRSIFWINIPVGILAAMLALRFIPESKASHARKVDVRGQTLVIAFLASLTFGIIQAPSYGWTSVSTLSVFGASLASLVAIVLWELRVDEPLIDIRFFRSLPFSAATLIAIGAFAGLGGFLFLNTLYLQSVKGLSALSAGFDNGRNALHLRPDLWKSRRTVWCENSPGDRGCRNLGKCADDDRRTPRDIISLALLVLRDLWHRLWLREHTHHFGCRVRDAEGPSRCGLSDRLNLSTDRLHTRCGGGGSTREHHDWWLL